MAAFFDKNAPRRVSQLDRIEIRHGVKVGFEVVGRGVRGVKTGDGVLDAKLVIDASGRGSRTPRWLNEVGIAGPRVEQIHVELGYATRVFTARAGAELDFDLLFQADTPERFARGGALCRIGRDRWLITLAGYQHDHPPADPEGFEAFARSLPAREIADALHWLVPEGEIVRSRFKTSFWRRYDEIAGTLRGLLVVGDAACSIDSLVRANHEPIDARWSREETMTA